MTKTLFRPIPLIKCLVIFVAVNIFLVVHQMEPLRDGFNDDGMMWPDDKYRLDLIGRAGVASADAAISVTDARLLSSQFARQSLQVSVNYQLFI